MASFHLYTKLRLHIKVLLMIAVIAVGVRLCLLPFKSSSGGSWNWIWSPDEHNLEVLFVGNSYTGVNDLANITQHIIESQSNVHAEIRSHYPGGETFRGHVAMTKEDYRPPGMPTMSHSASNNIYGNPTENELRKWLVTKPLHWKWVILQEQSQVPGFWGLSGVAPDESYNTSLYSAMQLNELIQRVPGNGSQTLFYMTWGRRNGDEYNRGLFPTYLEMQRRITAGYMHYQRATSTADRTTYIAPVGLVFERIYNYSLAHENPGTDPSSLFYQLYFDDGSHPSMAGSYVAALTIYATMLGEDPRLVRWYPEELESDIIPQLKKAVADIVLETATNGMIQYPWRIKHDNNATSKSEKGELRVRKSDWEKVVIKTKEGAHP